MAISLRPKYYQVGTSGKHELYKATDPEDRKLPFRFDTLNEEEIEREMAQLEADLGIIPELES